ncbi:MAG TPA: 7-cyano-7-deazaguanine synthase QueC [Anaeromyxobacteraceae bacterium]|nr:7-cyano-7-deazaguanine synthase QueC [Anaeromyxobacteraceae bacterium]
MPTLSPPHRPRAVVLLSGGLDSSTCLAIAVHERFEAHALSVDYGQRHRGELQRARRIARALGAASHRAVRVDLSAFGGSALTDPAIEVPKKRRGKRASSDAGGGRARQEIPVTYVPARNTVLLGIALAWAEVLGAADIFIGVNAVDYSGYPDCRPEFVRAFERLARVATRAGVEGQPFRVRAPLLRKSKAQIVRIGTALAVPYHLTLSCYDPVRNAACGRCDACMLRRKGFEDAGIDDPTVYAR